MNLKLNIATAKAHTGPFQNKAITWEDLVKRLSETKRTDETVKDYFAMAKDKQAKIKDVGGFVGGYLKDGIRRTGNVVFRQIVALDVDYSGGGFDTWLDFINLNCAGMYYTTHKHTPKEPRYRIVFPLNRQCTPEEYEAVARIVADWLNIEVFDDTTYQPTRLMYYPSTSKDGEFLTDNVAGPWLDVDDTLATLPDWTDPTTWPVSERVAARRTNERKAAKVEDPASKSGVIGAFCRVYSITDAIETFLSDVYTPCQAFGTPRYTYINGTSAGGLVVYDDALAFSHHSTDPAEGRTLNAFDLVRIHKFGELDNGADWPDITKSPSFKAMAEFSANIKEVKRDLVEHRRAEAVNDFDDLAEAATEKALAPLWVDELQVSKKGVILSTIHNVVLILQNDEALAGRLGFNAFEQREVITAAMPWDPKGLKYPRPMSDADEAQIRYYLEHSYDITGVGKITDGINIAIRSNTFHPIRDYLDALEWDGVARLDALLITLFGADDSPYIRNVTRKFFTAAVARAYTPGVKFDYVLTIIGEQGIGKSTMFNLMAREWFTESLTVFKGREALETIQGSWICELAEMTGLRKAEVEEVKHFISKTEDRFRVAYGKRIEHFPRSCVFGATTNEDDPLRDTTGNRRFWVVNVKGRKGKVHPVDYLTKTTVAQLWAEARNNFANGETLYLDAELEDVARSVQDSHLETDERTGLVLDYLSKLLPEGWEEKGLYDRRSYLNSEDEVKLLGKNVRTTVCALEIWAEALGNDPSKLQRSDSLQLARILKSLRCCTPYKAERVPLYGSQKIYRVNLGNAENE